jgi:hypothetical protein
MIGKEMPMRNVGKLNKGNTNTTNYERQLNLRG